MTTKGKIRVLECIRQGKIGGGESHLLSLMENIDRTRFEPLVLSFTDGPMVDRLNEMKIATHIIHTTKPYDFTKWGKVKQLLKDQDVDIVHAHGSRAGSNILWASRSLKIPVVYTIHGWSFHDDQHPLVKRLRIMGEKYLTSRTQKNIAVSLSNKNSGKKYINDFEAIVINNGIDQHKFSSDKSYVDIRKDLGIPNNAVLALFVARFTTQKQPLLLIRAFKETLKSVPGMYLLMVGDGDQKEEAVQLAKELGIEDRIIFQSFRQDVPALLAGSDMFILPSLWEGLPIGLLEAMAMGKAVIATDVDGTTEVVKHNENGLLIEPGNQISLSGAMIKLATNPDLRSRIMRSAVETVRTRFNATRMTSEIENVYNQFFATESTDKKFISSRLADVS